MTLTGTQTFIIICMATLGTMVTRFLPFILFKNTNTENSYTSYLGQVLPFAAIGLLVVYCLKEISFKSSNLWAPEIIAVLVTSVIHYLKENTLLSISIGTITYMVLVQGVFV